MYEIIYGAAVAAVVITLYCLCRRRSFRQEVLQALGDQEWSYMPNEFFPDEDIFYCSTYWVTFEEGPTPGSDIITIARRDPKGGAVLEEGHEILLFRNYDPIDKDPLVKKIQGIVRRMRIQNGRGIHLLT